MKLSTYWPIIPLPTMHLCSGARSTTQRRWSCWRTLILLLALAKSARIKWHTRGSSGGKPLSKHLKIIKCCVTFCCWPHEVDARGPHICVSPTITYGMCSFLGMSSFRKKFEYFYFLFVINFWHTRWKMWQLYSWPWFHAGWTCRLIKKEECLSPPPCLHWSGAAFQLKTVNPAFAS